MDRALHGLAQALGAISADVSRDFAGPHREADQRDVREIQRTQHDVEVGREDVVVIPHRRLGGPPKTPAIISNDAVAGREQGCRLLLPGGNRP